MTQEWKISIPATSDDNSEATDLLALKNHVANPVDDEDVCLRQSRTHVNYQVDDVVEEENVFFEAGSYPNRGIEFAYPIAEGIALYDELRPLAVPEVDFDCHGVATLRYQPQTQQWSQPDGERTVCFMDELEDAFFQLDW
jgi:hypothetical protein